MGYLFTSESVSEGHPDKISDQISDAILDQFLAFDPQAKVGIETLVTTGQVILAGEVRSSTYVDVQKVARQVIADIGYTKSEYQFDAYSCGILSAIHEQSQEINQGIEREKKEEQGAGDQGMMFGYATNETENYIPLPLDLSHRILKELAKIRHENNEIQYLRPDSKCQVTVEYDNENIPIRIDSIVISTQHDDFAEDQFMSKQIKRDLIHVLIPRVKAGISKKLHNLFTDDITYHINPTGKFVIGGPHGDTGLTGRKIIVDTYGGKGAHGGGAFSGKDPSKVDRSAAYAARHIAKNLAAAGIAEEVLVQLSYAIGIAEPTGIYINTYNTSKVKLTDGQIASKIRILLDLRPYAIEQRLKLRKPIYSETARYGHMGRVPRKKKKSFENTEGKVAAHEVELFTWEKTDLVDLFKKEIMGAKVSFSPSIH